MNNKRFACWDFGGKYAGDGDNEHGFQDQTEGAGTVLVWETGSVISALASGPVVW